MSKTRSRLLLTTFLCSGTLLAGGAQKWEMDTIDHLNSPQGLVQIDWVGINGYRLSVGGQLLAELECSFLSISDVLPAANAPQYVLLKVSTGGASCPQLYRLLDLSPGRKVYLTGEFGTCGPVTTMTLQGNDVMFDFAEFPPFKPQNYLYDSTGRRIRKAARGT